MQTPLLSVAPDLNSPTSVQVAMMLAEHLDISVAEACHHFGTAITERNAEDAYAQKSDGTLCVAGLAQALTSSFVKVRGMGGVLLES